MPFMIDAHGVTPIPAPTISAVLYTNTCCDGAPCGASTRKNGLLFGPITLPSVVAPVVGLRVTSSISPWAVGSRSCRYFATLFVHESGEASTRMFTSRIASSGAEEIVNGCHSGYLVTVGHWR